MSIETLTLLKSVEESVEDVEVLIRRLKPFCANIQFERSDEGFQIALLLHDERTIWGQTREIKSTDVLSAIDPRAKACLALESGLRRSATETAIIFALPALLLTTNTAIWVINPQQEMTAINDIAVWQESAVREIEKDLREKKQDASQIYRSVCETILMDSG